MNATSPRLSLNQRNALILKNFLDSLEDDKRKAMFRSFRRLRDSNIGSAAVNTGDMAPGFTLPNFAGDSIGLSNMLAMGPVVLSFYRGGWCPFCNLELRSLQEVLPDIIGAGASLLAVSPESIARVKFTMEKNQLDFYVLSDAGNKVTRQYGLLFQIDEDLRPLFLEWGLDIPAHNLDDTWEVPIPATYIINTDGRVFESYVEKDYTKRMEPEAILRALERINAQSEPH